MSSSPDFVAVGHIVRDVAPDGYRLGGTVTFAAAQAHRLGLSVGIVTRTGPDLPLDGYFDYAEVANAPVVTSTSFENVYLPEGRVQRLLARAAPIEASDVPTAWNSAPIVLLGPVFHDVPPGFAKTFDAGSLIGVSAQGWLRGVGPGQRVHHAAWTGEPFWAGAGIMFASDEDLAGDEDELARWTNDVPIVAVTRSSRGARVFADGRWREMAAYPEIEVDATGAGDTFATAFLIRYRESGDANESARFGAAAASLSVRGIGADSLGDRDAINERLRQHPEIALR